MQSLSSSTDLERSIINKKLLNDTKVTHCHDKFKSILSECSKDLELRKLHFKMLAWCLSRYYKGLVLWSWCYPCHYVPMLSDLENIDDILQKYMKFNVDELLKPFNQLLGSVPLSMQIGRKPHKLTMCLGE